jgi:hypothetical protein
MDYVSDDASNKTLLLSRYCLSSNGTWGLHIETDETHVKSMEKIPAQISDAAVPNTRNYSY